MERPAAETKEEYKEGEDDEPDLIDVDMKEEGLEFEEWALETDYEPSEVTAFYIQESKKLKQGKIKSYAVERESDDDEDELEKVFLDNAAK